MAKKFFAFGDVHFPFHAPAVVELILKAQQQFKPDITTVLGDVLDCGAFSSHPTAKSEQFQHDYEHEEVEPARKMLRTVSRHTRGPVYLLEGNHEERISRWCARIGAAGPTIFKRLDPRTALTRGTAIRWVPYTSDSDTVQGFVSIHPKLVAVHGWSYCKDAAAKHLSLSRTRSILFGHTHRAQSECSRDPWSGEPIQALSCGCACKRQPIYLTGGTPSSWVHGFVVGWLGQHSFTLYSIVINNNSCVLPDGKEVRV